MTQPTTIFQRPAELLRDLIRFDTTNPPGNEAACIAYIQDHLHSLGIETQIYEKLPGRPNLIARIKGRGDAPPLLLQGHVDVVPTANQPWTVDPFAADVRDGFIWGRGTLDMKGGDTMMIAAFLRAYAEDANLPGDVILCMLSDEEEAGINGAGFLVKEHPELFDGVKYAIGEFGGFSTVLGGRRFYPIMISEKQSAWLKIRLHGPGGHGSSPHRAPFAATAKLGALLDTLNTMRLPVHITPPVEHMISVLAEELPEPMNAFIAGLLDPAQTDAILDRMGDAGKSFDALLHNTISPNMIRGGEKVNVIPSMIEIDLDGRLVPGQTMDTFLAELTDILGDDMDIETVYFEEGPTRTDMGMFGTLADILKQADPDGVPLPYMLPAVTDARFFATLGIQTYGFTPMQLPDDFQFMTTIHAADERIPVGAVEFGTEMVYQALLRFHG